MSKAKFVTGSITRHVINMAWPALVVIAVNLSIVLVDTYFISRLGNDPLTAMGFVFPIIEMVQGIGIGMGIAISTGIAQLLGQQEYTKANEYFGLSLIISAVFGAVFVSGGMIFHDAIFKALGANHVIIPYVWQFMKIWFPALFVYMMLFAINFGMRGHGEIKINSTLFILTAVLNLIFDPFLIFGLAGFPKLGIAGAALAGLLARSISLLIYMYILNTKGWVSWPQKINIKSYLRRFIKTCIPASLTNFIPPISIAVTTAMLASITFNAVAAFGIATRIQMLAVIPMFALSGAISSIVAQNHSAKLFDRAEQALNLSIYCSALWGAIAALILFIIKTPVMLTFSKNPEIVIIGTQYLTLVPISYIGWGMIMMLCSYFNAIGKPLLATSTSLLRMIIVFVPLAWLLKHFYGYQGIFIALTISNLSIAFVAWAVQNFYSSNYILTKAG